MNRREFIQSGAAAAAILGVGRRGLGRAAAAVGPARPPNILLILTDQQHIDALSAAGNPHLRTPAMDRIHSRGVRFSQSYCVHPACIPSRATLFTGRMPSETGMWFNSSRAGRIEDSIPSLGEWARTHSDYQTIYAGKWHVPQCHTHTIPGFDVIASGLDHWGDLTDELVSRSCAAWLRARDRSRPFLMVASFIQPHDICTWLSLNTKTPPALRYPGVEDDLPPLPPNHAYDESTEPARVAAVRAGQQPAEGAWTAAHWRYYLWNYYRHVEMADAEIGRLLDALDAAGDADDTLIVFTSDHGEGMGEHHMVRKSFMYDSAARAPLVFRLPGRIRENVSETTELASGADLVPTLCDFMGIPAPPDIRGVSLRPILEGGTPAARPLGDFVVCEDSHAPGRIAAMGRMVRSRRYKYIRYLTDENEQLFDMHADPGEQRNLARDPASRSALAAHRDMLLRWETNLKLAPRCVKLHGDLWLKT